MPYYLPLFCAPKGYKKKVITDFCFQLVKETSTEKSLFPIIIYINSTWEEWKWKLNHDNFIEIFAFFNIRKCLKHGILFWKLVFVAILIQSFQI